LLVDRLRAEEFPRTICVCDSLHDTIEPLRTTEPKRARLFPAKWTSSHRRLRAARSRRDVQKGARDLVRRRGRTDQPCARRSSIELSRRDDAIKIPRLKSPARRGMRHAYCTPDQSWTECLLRPATLDLARGRKRTRRAATDRTIRSSSSACRFANRGGSTGAARAGCRRGSQQQNSRTIAEQGSEAAQNRRRDQIWRRHNNRLRQRVVVRLSFARNDCGKRRCDAAMAIGPAGMRNVRTAPGSLRPGVRTRTSALEFDRRRKDCSDASRGTYCQN